MEFQKLCIVTIAIFLGMYLGFGYSEEETGSKECTSDPNYIYPNPKNCSMFYKCWDGKLYPIPCPDSLAFNAELSVCDWRWNVSTCDQEAKTDFGLGVKATK